MSDANTPFDKKFNRVKIDADLETIVAAFNFAENIVKGSQPTANDFARYYYLDGRLKFSKKEYDASIEAFKKSFKIITDFELPDNHEIYYWYARIFEIRGDKTNAQGYLKFALETYKENPELISKAEIMQAMGVTVEPPKQETLSDIYKKAMEQNKIKELSLNFIWDSPDHLRYENGHHVSGPHQGGAPRRFKIEPINKEDNSYLISLFNLETGTPIGQMVPKQMKIIAKEIDKTVLRGYGTDNFGTNISDYGLTIFHSDKQVFKIILHYIDRKVDIEYHP